MVEKRRGRRPKRKYAPGDRVPMSLRVTLELKARIEEAADASGRSQSQEVEFRLEQSLGKQQLLNEILTLSYGPRVAGILRVLGEAMASTARHAGTLSNLRFGQYVSDAEGLERALDWTNNPYAYDQVVLAVQEVLEAFRPAGEIQLPTLSDAAGASGKEIERGFARQGELIAGSVLASAKTAWGPAPMVHRTAHELQPLLGDLVDRADAYLNRETRKSNKVES